MPALNIRVMPGKLEFAEGETYEASEIWLLTTIREQRMLVMTSRDREIGSTIVYQHCP